MAALTPEQHALQEDYGLAILEAGFSWVRLYDGEKVPIGNKWQTTVSRDPEALLRWLDHHSQIGFFPAPGSRVFVTDVDKPSIIESAFPPLPDTLIVDSGSGLGKYHVYLALPDGVEESEVPATFEGGEVARAGSRQMVGPFSTHPDTGKLYLPRNGMAVREASRDWIAALRRSHEAMVSQRVRASSPADEGWFITHGRHEFLVDRARNLRGLGLSGVRLVEELVRIDAERNRPPLATLPARGVEEIESIAAWINTHISDDLPPIEIIVPSGSLGSLPPRLPVEFWEERAYLKVIRQAAHSAQRAPDVVLGGVLARVSAMADYNIGLPGVVGSASNLALYVITVGQTGLGKSSSAAIPEDLWPSDDLKVVPGGSGQGVIEAYFEKVQEEDDHGKLQWVKRQKHHNLLIYVDEGHAAVQSASRGSGDSFFANLRSMFTGGLAGDNNASLERWRVLPRASYQLGVVIGFQPSLIGALFDEDEAGTPGRFLYLANIDPTLPDEPPEWPGRIARHPIELEPHDAGVSSHWRYLVSVPEGVRREIRQADLDKVRGAVVPAALDAHRNLVRFKVAALLAMLDSRLDVSEPDWELAGVVMDTSDGVRDWAKLAVTAAGAKIEAETGKRLGRRAVLAESMLEEHRTHKVAERLALAAQQQPGELTPGKARAGLGHAQRDHFAVALDYAISMDWVELRTEAGQGTDSARLWPAKARP